MRGVALGALGNVFLLFRIVRHISMGTDLFAAGRHVIGGSFDEIAEGSVATETLVFCLRAQNPGENQNANAAEKQPKSHAPSSFYRQVFLLACRPTGNKIAFRLPKRTEAR